MGDADIYDRSYSSNHLQTMDRLVYLNLNVIRLNDKLLLILASAMSGISNELETITIANVLSYNNFDLGDRLSLASLSIFLQSLAHFPKLVDLNLSGLVHLDPKNEYPEDVFFHS